MKTMEPRRTATQSILQYKRAGRSRAEIIRLVGCSPGFVTKVLTDFYEQSPRTVQAYVCEGCDEAGVYFKTTLRPCQRCRARGGK